MHKALILWDIDGTILHSGGAGMRALQRALDEVFGIAGTFEGIDFAGRTDPVIIRQIFARFGIEASRENFARYIDGYIAVLPAVLGKSDSRILPGAAELIRQAAAAPDVAQGLLTGNLRRGAATKLGHHGLWEYFPIGAFADDSEVRNELGPFALERARGHFGTDFPAGNVWIVGDTPHDIACARAFGGRSLAVATGSSRVSDLAGHNPDAVLETLGDAEAFWSVIRS